MRDDRRSVPRERLFQPASVVFNGRRSMMQCSVRNWSAGGAMVRLSDWIELPETFEIDLADIDQSVRVDQSMRVRQCWRRGDDVGVSFVTEAEMSASEPISLALRRTERDANG